MHQPAARLPDQCMHAVNSKRRVPPQPAAMHTPAAAGAHLEAHDDDPHHPEDVGAEQAREHVELVLHLARVDHVEQLRGGSRGGQGRGRYES